MDISESRRTSQNVINNKSYYVLHTHTQSVSHNTTILSVSDEPLHWVQLHVSALGIGHHQVVLRLIEELYNKLGIRAEGGWWGFLRIFERLILIFGPVQNEDGSWRIRMNYELNELIQNADIVRFINSRRIA